MPRTGFLAEMYEGARGRVERARAARPLQRPRAPYAGPSFHEALRRPPAGGLAVIAEVKRASPSKGPIAPDLDAAGQAVRYRDAGADAVSVLTEPERFGGSLDDLRAVTAACELPALRKDFIVDEYQVWEAVEAGAAAVLLVAALLDRDRLAWLLGEAHDLGLDPLLEVHDERDVETALELEAHLVGVNNRDLGTLRVDLATTERLAPLLGGASRLIVAESGIATRDDARRMRSAGAHAVLVGEALVRESAAALAGRLAALRGAITGERE